MSSKYHADNECASLTDLKRATKIIAKVFNFLFNFYFKNSLNKYSLDCVNNWSKNWKLIFVIKISLYALKEIVLIIKLIWLIKINSCLFI